MASNNTFRSHISNNTPINQTYHDHVYFHDELFHHIKMYHDISCCAATEKRFQLSRKLHVLYSTPTLSHPLNFHDAHEIAVFLLGPFSADAATLNFSSATHVL